jgi:hypothetical protein
MRRLRHVRLQGDVGAHAAAAVVRHAAFVGCRQRGARCTPLLPFF